MAQKKEKWTIGTKMLFDRRKLCSVVDRLFSDNAEERAVKTSTERDDE